VPERFLDVRGARLALAIAAIAASLLCVLAQPAVACSELDMLVTQLVAVVAIVALAVRARRYRTPGTTIVLDAIVMLGSLGATIAALRWTYPFATINDIAVALTVTGVAALVIHLRWRGRVHAGPVALATFFLVKGFVFGYGMAEAIGGMKTVLRAQLAVSSTGSTIFAIVGGACLTMPVAFALLAFWPNRDEGTEWEHLT
jgi:hypothetical protein